jgi:GntR family transcriptional regulator
MRRTGSTAVRMLVNAPNASYDRVSKILGRFEGLLMADAILSPIDRFPNQKLTRENGPLYRQLADLIRGLITRGELGVGSDLPKEAEIEARLGVSLITVRRALRELEDLGLIQKRSAKPAKVTAKSPSVRAGMKFDSLEDLVNFTVGARLVVTSYSAISSPVFERYFGMSSGEEGWCLSGYLEKGGQPRTLITTYFPLDIGSQLKIEDFTDVLIFANVIRCLGIKIERVLVTARAEIANKSQARLLDIPTGSPMLTTEMVYLDDRQRPIEVTFANTSSEHFVLSYDVPFNTN